MFAGVTGLLLGCGKAESPTEKAEPPGFAKDIQPILARYCHECHGEMYTESRLDTRTLDMILKGGESGPAVVPKQPAVSLLYEMMRDEQMPPEGAAPSPAELELVRQWILEGAQP